MLTIGTESVIDDLLVPHEQPELGNIFGQSAFNSKIDYLRASLADEVAVRVGVAVLVDALVERLKRRYQTHITEQAQIAVDGAETYLRQLGAHTRIYRVRSWVIASRFYDFQNSITL